MPPPEVRQALFHAIDSAGPDDLANPKGMRLYLYDVALAKDQSLAESLDDFIDLLLEEFCAGQDVPRKK